MGCDNLSRSMELEQEVVDECNIVTGSFNEIFKMWTLPVIHALGLKSPARFNELKRRMKGISATSLSERLNDLEKKKIIERKVFPETPPRVEYSLTKKGMELYSILKELAEWIIKWEK
jgi:DNA-binding HxlR family transcriptional regulator